MTLVNKKLLVAVASKKLHYHQFPLEGNSPHERLAGSPDFETASFLASCEYSSQVDIQEVADAPGSSHVQLEVGEVSMSLRDSQGAQIYLID